MNILGNIVTLRGIERADLGLIVDMFNSPEIEGLVVGWSFPLSMHQQERWFESHGHNGTDLRFVIDTPADGPVGIATLTGIDWKNRRANEGLKIKASATRRKGYGTDTIMALLRYAFDELQLVRVDSSWLADNEVSEKTHIKCGFKKEGIRKKYIFKNGSYKDLVVAGILEDEYRASVFENGYWHLTNMASGRTILTEQNRTEQNRTEQNRTEQVIFSLCRITAAVVICALRARALRSRAGRVFCARRRGIKR